MSNIRETEAKSIFAYVKAAATRGCFVGRVLDYGAGKQPYRKIVEDAGADYVPFDRMEFPGSVVTTDIGDDDPLNWGVGIADGWDAILSTQTIQYLNSPEVFAQAFYAALRPGGRLVLTGPTNWPVVETTDLHRYTVEGIVAMLGNAGFPLVDCHYRAHVTFEGERWPLGWGAIAAKEDS